MSTLKRYHATVELRLVWNQNPHGVLDAELVHGGYVPCEEPGASLYFNENDGYKIQEIGHVINHLLPPRDPEYQQVEWFTDNRNSAWVSCCGDDDEVAAMAGRVFRIRVTETREVQEDGSEEWVSLEAELCPENDSRP